MSRAKRRKDRGSAGCGRGGLRIRGQAGGRAQHRGKVSNGLIDAMTISSKSTDKTRDRSSFAPSLVREAAFHSKMEKYLSRFDIINEYNSDEAEREGERERRAEEDSSDLHLGFHL